MNRRQFLYAGAAAVLATALPRWAYAVKGGSGTYPQG